MASAGSDRSLPHQQAVSPAAIGLGAPKARRIAIVSPHRRFGGRAARHLSDSSYDVWTVLFSRTLLDDLAGLSPDVVILEHVNSAGIDLVRVCRDMADTLAARIIVVSDGDELAEQVHVAALDAGADDVLTASVSAALFLARIRVALRRRPAAWTRPDLIQLGDLMLDIEAHTLYLSGELTKCPPLQFTLLTALGQAPNRVLDKATLANAAWRDLPQSLQSRRLRVAISVLRHILGTGPQRPRVESVSNVGYRLVVETAAAPGTA